MLRFHKSWCRIGEYTKGSSVAKNELHTGKIKWHIHLQTSSFSPSSYPRSVMCESLYSRIGLASQGKPHMLQNCCMKIYFDLTNLGTDTESTRRAARWPKRSFILEILNDLFTCKLHLSLPTTTRGPLYASHCIQEWALLVKVSPICFKLSVSKHA